MKRAVIITNAFATNVGQQYQVSRLTEEFGKLGVSLIHRVNVGLASVVDGRAVSDVADYDFVLYFDKDKHISKLLEKSGVVLFNSADSIELSDDKMATYTVLCNNGIAMPNTVSSPLCYSAVADDTDFVLSVEKLLDYPMVLKQCYGSFGRQVHMVANREQLLTLRLDLKYEPHLIQQCITSSLGEDTRVIVVGGKAFAWMQRRNENDFRSNIEAGGKGIICDLPDSYRFMAESAAKILNLDYCGIDILRGKNGEPILCEVNSNAFFRGIEGVTGKNVAGAYAKHVCDKIYGVG